MRPILSLLIVLLLAYVPSDVAGQAATALQDARSLQDEARFEEALEGYRAAAEAEVAARELSASTWAEWGGLLLRMGRHGEAGRHFRTYLDHARERPGGLTYGDEGVLMGLAGAEAYAGQWPEARATLQAALALTYLSAADEAAIRAALSVAAEAEGASPPDGLAPYRFVLALAGSDRFDTSYPVGFRAVAVETGSRLLAAGRIDEGLAALDQADRAYGDDDCVADAARLLTLADLFARGPLHHPVRAMAQYDNAAAIPARFRAAADLPPGTLREPADTAVHEPLALAFLRLEGELGPRAARMAALAAAEEANAPEAVDRLWISGSVLERDPRERVGCSRPRRILWRDARSHGFAWGVDDDRPVRERLADVLVPNVLGIVGMADSLALTGEGALTWLVGRDTLVSWLVLPTGEVEAYRVAVGEEAFMRMVDEARRSHAAASRLAGLLLPTPLRTHLPYAGRFVLAAPPAFRDVALTALTTGPLEGDYDIVPVATVAGYLLGEEWRERRHAPPVPTAPPVAARPAAQVAETAVPEDAVEGGLGGGWLMELDAVSEQDWGMASLMATSAELIASPLAEVRTVLGDSAAVEVLFGSDVLSVAVEEGVAALRAAGSASLEAGRYDEAARRFEQAADLASRRADAAAESDDPVMWGRAHQSAAESFRQAAEAWASAGNPLRQARVLTTAALKTWNAELGFEAFQLQQDAPPGDRAHTLLVLERLFRHGPRPGAADTALVFACGGGCGLATEEGARVYASVREALIGSGDGVPSAADARDVVRSLLGLYLERERGARLAGIDMPFPEARLRWAADSARSSDDRAWEATLRHALAYQLLESGNVGGADGDTALASLRRAATLRRAAGDRTGEASSLGLLALVHLGRSATAPEATDSARAAIIAAEQAAQHAVTAAGSAEHRASAVALQATLRRRHAQVAAAAGDHGEAERMLAEALALRGDPASAMAANDRYWLARQYVDGGSGSAALPHARASYQVVSGAGASTLAARSAELLAEAHALEARPDSAARWLTVAAGIRQEDGDMGRWAHTLSAAAETHLEAGAIDQADALLQAAMSAARERETTGRPGDAPVPGLLSGDALLARLLNTAGLLALAREQWTEARDLFAGARLLAPIEHPENREAERNQALAGMILGDAAEAEDLLWALSWADHGLRSIRWSMSPARPLRRPLTRGWIQTHVAELHGRRGGLTGMREAVDAAIPLLEEAGHGPSLQRALAVKGRLFMELGRPDSAAVYLAAAGENGQRTASDAVRQQVMATDPAEVPALLADLLAESRRIGDRLGEARVLEALGFYHLRRKDPADPALAALWYDSAAVALMDVDQRGLDDWHQVQLREQFARLQQESALAWLARARELGPATAAAGALAAADRGRARAFEALVRATSPGRGFILGSVWESLRFDDAWLPDIGRDLLRGELSYGGPGRATLSYLQTSDTLIAWLHLPSGELRAVRHALAADSLAGLVSRARAAMGVDSAGTRDLRGVEEDPLTPLLLFGEETVPPADRALRELADVLLPHELRHILPPQAELLVIPAGPVAAVPFAALPVDAAGTPLSARFSLRYAPSLATLHGFTGVLSGGSETLPLAPYGAGADSMQDVRNQWLARAVVVGNPTMPQVRGPDGVARRLSPLPGAEREAREIGALLGTGVLTGDAATVNALRSSVADATIVHLATHGWAYGREDRVADSYVALAPGPDNDGLLTVADLLDDPDLRMDAASLVVLSACQTALGQLTESEGTLGLQRAFLARGARTVLVSLWSVSDQATEQLVRRFYHHWLGDDDPTKAEALRRAQEDLRGVPAFSHPRYWAAFQLVGAS